MHHPALAGGNICGARRSVDRFLEATLLGVSVRLDSMTSIRAAVCPPPRLRLGPFFLRRPHTGACLLFTDSTSRGRKPPRALLLQVRQIQLPAETALGHGPSSLSPAPQSHWTFQCPGARGQGPHDASQAPSAQPGYTGPCSKPSATKSLCPESLGLSRAPLSRSSCQQQQPPPDQPGLAGRLAPAPR